MESQRLVPERGDSADDATHNQKIHRFPPVFPIIHHKSSLLQIAAGACTQSTRKNKSSPGKQESLVQDRRQTLLGKPGPRPKGDGGEDTRPSHRRNGSWSRAKLAEASRKKATPATWERAVRIPGANKEGTVTKLRSYADVVRGGTRGLPFYDAPTVPASRRRRHKVRFSENSAILYGRKQ